MKRHAPEQKPATVNGRPTRNYICLVDGHRRPGTERSTAGRYRVGAKNPKEARRLLQRTIGFGSVLVHYEDNTEELSPLLPLGVCMKETYNKATGRYDHVDARHATAPCA